MLVLYETPLGLCLFKLTDAGKLENDSLWEEFQTPERAASLYVLSFDILRRLLNAQRIALGVGYVMMLTWYLQSEAQGSSSVLYHCSRRRRPNSDTRGKNIQKC